MKITTHTTVTEETAIEGKPLVTINQIAAHYGVTRVCVVRWLKRYGVAPAIRLHSRFVRYDFDTVKAALSAAAISSAN